MPRSPSTRHPRATRLHASWNPPSGQDPGATITLTYAGQEYRRDVGPEDLVTQREAALLLGVSVMAVNKHVRAGTLQASVHGGVSVIRLSEVRRFARDRGLMPDTVRPLPWLGRLVRQLAPPLARLDEASVWQPLTLQERVRAPRAAQRSRSAARPRRKKRRVAHAHKSRR